jgi:hypothetical protein
MQTLTMAPTLEEKKRFRHATVYIVKDAPTTAVVEATTNYIPIDQFKEIFEYVAELTKTEHLTKLIFDKRKLTVFHQPSMEWYFVEWKEEMAGLGMTKHRKILPSDDVFKQSVRIGREKLSKQYPKGKFHELDIQYANSLEEAILN